MDYAMRKRIADTAIHVGLIGFTLGSLILLYLISLQDVPHEKHYNRSNTRGGV
jgi:hypothetical protein